MTDHLRRLAAIVDANTSIDDTILEMHEISKHVAHPGIALVLDEKGCLQGMVTDGDIRRAYATKLDFQLPVSRIMIRDPISVPSTMPMEDVVPEVYRRVRQTARLRSHAVQQVLVCDSERRVVNIYDFMELLSDLNVRVTHVAVIGLGYVGLTLAVHLASAGHVVTGVDISSGLIEQLAAGKPHVREPGLKDLLSQALTHGNLTFSKTLDGRKYRVYIVCVGSPVDSAGKPDLSALRAALESIAPGLEQGDIVMLRSTLPVGTTRDMVVALLNNRSGLEAGTDYCVAFTPERTSEGQAMRELRTLPQIVGGLTQRCTSRAGAFWSTVSPIVINVSSLEAAELVKLANNSFRDLSFGFSNELALVAGRYNINAFELVQAANEGYPRNRIPTPSPGVGGYCLTKDPLLYASAFEGGDEVLPRAGRRANAAAARYPVSVLERFAEKTGRNLRDLRVLLIGIAFKGEPETDDLRGSTALDIAGQLTHLSRKPLAWDAVVPPAELEARGLSPVIDRDAAIREVDAVLILNNHRLNVPSEFGHLANGAAKLIFDGWNMVDRREIEQIGQWRYATMGYMTV